MFIGCNKKGEGVVDMALRALSVTNSKIIRDMDELSIVVNDDWLEDLSKFDNVMDLRDQIVDSFAPEIYGLDLIKLGVLLCLCTCQQTNDSENQDDGSKKTIHSRHNRAFFT